MTRKKATLWITDPWNTLDHPNDTSLRLAEEGLKLGIPQYWCDVRSIRLDYSEAKLDAQQILHPLQILAIGLEGSKKTELVNPLSVLLQGNEKMEAAFLRKAKLFPPSLVSSQWDKLREFGKKHGRTVLKPLYEAQSHGVELLDWSKEDRVQNAKLLLSAATHGFYQPVLLQSYLEGISKGETRLWFLDGKLLAAVKKLPVSGDFRVNIDQGSQLQKTKLNRAEKLAALKIASYLRSRKIRLAAVDLIEGWVTDFNFTSPGLITKMEPLLGLNLARTIVKRLSRA
ncbi:MAG: hypothetical protein HYX41_03150 [Bdellovibrio sp.]|nr:hypothetical protein [Bdellovibrio sp.]